MMENTILQMTGHRGEPFCFCIIIHVEGFKQITSLLFIVCILRADQFDYVMYGKVYKIEGDETSTEAATRL